MSNQSLGTWGEDIACRYLEGKGYKIIERNFRRKWGEIDIVCRKVVPRGTLQQDPERASRSVLRRTLDWIGRTFGTQGATPRTHVENLRKKSDEQTMVFVEVKTLQPGDLMPEDNITPAKMRKLIRSCHLYLAVKNYNLDTTDWQIDTVGIVVDKEARRAKVTHLKQAIYL